MSASVEARSPRVVVVDNYDSFTFNIVHALELAGARCAVLMNDESTVPELLARQPDGFVLSAGPCTPEQSGVSLPLVRALIALDAPPPLLGICLGQQAIAQAMGARLRRARRPLHGMTARIRHDGRGLLAALPTPLVAARYNSLVIDERTLPAELEPSAWDEDNELMALRHRTKPLAGVQFHPESALSVGCAPLFGAWVERCRAQQQPTSERAALAHDPVVVQALDR